jgi:Golgi apparatus protein 1
VEHAASLSHSCQHELLRVAELQADDYHKDRQLYFACREDREIFCSKVGAGSGKVYGCLYKHKFDVQMSSACRQQLTNRQRLEQKDFKVNHGLTIACQHDLISNDCSKSGSTMSDLLVCLEDAARDGKVLTAECVIELSSVRRNLVEDYLISPEIANSCSTEINQHCKGVSRREIVHCLMDLARQRNQSVIQPSCKQQLTKLMHEANIGEDYSVDPILQEACDTVVKLYCGDIRPGEGRVYNCLLSAIDRPQMKPECKEKLLEVHYFVSRDFKLNPRFYKECSNKKQTACPVPDGGSAKVRANTLFCLYQKLKENQGISEACMVEVKVVMTERAKGVELEPEIEDLCLLDLANYCTYKTRKNEEMDCLEDNLEKLKPPCKEIVEQYIEKVDNMPEIDSLFAAACEPFWKSHCLDVAQAKKGQTELVSLMSCLIEYKNDVDMPPKCRAGIEHHQLVTMSLNFTISHLFRDACQTDVQQLCPKATKKSMVIECLSSIVRSDTLLDRVQKVSVNCRNQLKFELLQRSEDIEVDHKLRNACLKDVRKHCSNIHTGKSRVIECLRNNAARLEPSCHELLFSRQKEEAEDPTTDYQLMLNCKKMIKKHCLSDLSSPEKIFSCLLKHKEEDDDFDEGCSHILVKRLRVRAHDIRLNPDLIRYCKKDIDIHCKSEFEYVVKLSVEGEGKVLFCLRRFFAQKKLTALCTEHISQIVKESVLDYVQDIRLAQACSDEIKQLCADAAEAEKNDENGGKGQVEECLNQQLLLQSRSKILNSKCVQELVRSLAENKADVHLDPVLFRACSLDIKGYCRDVVRGEGRQMSCLISALDDSSYQLQSGCRNQLKARVELWGTAVKVAPPDSIRDLIAQVYESNSSSYLLTVIFGVIACIFIGGLFCGRLTKHISRKVKAKL